MDFHRIYSDPLFITISGGVAVLLIAALGRRLFLNRQSAEKNTQTQTVTVNNYLKTETNEKAQVSDVLVLKAKIKILFIDDDVFPQIKNLLKIGWQVSRIKDAIDLEQTEIRDADVIFVDYKGVGKLSNNQGLGLVTGLKQRYGKKKWIIFYSAHPFKLDVFDNGADSFLAKNSDVYEIERKIVEGAARIES